MQIDIKTVNEITDRATSMVGAAILWEMIM